MAVRRFGDWEKAKRLLANNPGHRMSMEIRKATIKNALLLAREIKRGIRNQAPGGQKFAPLAQITIEKKGSSKALIDTGFLINSITEKIVGDQAFIGLLRTSVYKDGENLANVGAIMEYGATINLPGGGAIVVPPRPFLHPVMVKYRDEVLANYRQAIRAILK